jgi:hypothetical protein
MRSPDEAYASDRATLPTTDAKDRHALTTFTSTADSSSHLVRQFGEILKQVRIPTELAGKLATVLRESQADKEKFVRTSMLR